MRTAALLAVLGLVVGCAAEAADRGQLLVTGAEGGVAAIDPDSGEREVLEEEGGAPSPVQPTASPDGDLVVWTALTDGGPVTRVRQDGATRDIQVPTVPYYYSFDAATSTVAALGNEPDGDGVALLMVDLSRDEARIVDSDRPYYLDWHPDETRLALHVGFRELALWEDGERRPLPIRPGDFQAPAWTEDGRLVALRRSEGAAVSLLQVQTEELVVVDVGDGSVETVTTVAGHVPFDVAGERVAFVEDGAGPLAVIGLNGEGRVEVSSDLVVAFEWSPDGDLLLFHTADEDARLIPHIWDGQESVAYPAYEPTGTFVSQYLPFWAQYTRTITQWAPDGSAFAYAAGRDNPAVWVQPRDGERREVGPGAMVTWVP